jgi:hypothetical protein
MNQVAREVVVIFLRLFAGFVVKMPGHFPKERETFEAQG